MTGADDSSSEKEVARRLVELKEEHERLNTENSKITQL